MPNPQSTLAEAMSIRRSISESAVLPVLAADACLPPDEAVDADDLLPVEIFDDADLPTEVFDDVGVFASSESFDGAGVGVGSSGLTVASWLPIILIVRAISLVNVTLAAVGSSDVSSPKAILL